MDDFFDVQDFDAQDTIPETSNEETENVGGGEEVVITPDNDGFANEDVARDTEEQLAQESVSENTAATEPFISVQYNHKNRDFTKKEAIEFIQKGMHTESLRAKLEFLARNNGTDVNSLVEKIVMAPENAYRKHLEDLYGKDSENVEIGMAIYREKQSEEYKNLVEEHEKSVREQLETKDINSRLADEYLELKAEIPDAPEYSELPDSVIIEAAEGKRDLCSAYLCYLQREKIKIEAAKKTQAEASAASSGRMGQQSTEGITSAERNFLSGLWGR